MKHDLIRQLVRREAFRAVGPSTVRGQKAPGVVRAARSYLSKVSLGCFSVADSAGFERTLNVHTARLQGRLPPAAQSWGLARKVMNIFLRHSLYNVYLRDHFNLAMAERFYEVPLDSLVARGVKSRFPPGCLPRWLGVRHLDAERSAMFQEAAAVIAYEWGIARVHLDAYFWLER